MPAAAPIKETEEWMPKDRAAKLLGASIRQLERRAQQGFVEKQVGERPLTERNAPVFYSRADILAIKAGKPNVYAREVKPGSEPATNGQKTGNGQHKPGNDAETTALAVVHDAPSDPFAGLAAHLASLARAYPPPAPALTPHMTLAEAVEYSGLPAAFLVAGAKAGTIRAVNVGNGKREFWRFAKEALAK